MASWVDLSNIHNPSPGTRPPASWGDGVASNLEALRGAKAAYLATQNTTTSTSFTDLGSVGPAVSLDTGTAALVIVGCTMNNDTAPNYILMGFAVTGASSVAADDAAALYRQQPDHSADFSASKVALVTGLTAGTNTFTAKYRVTGGTGTFYRRLIAVIPLFS